MTTTSPETAPGITVNDILDRYIRDGMDHLAPRTRGNYRRHIKHLRRAFGDRIAADLKPRDFGPWLQVKKGLQHRVRGLAVLSSAFTKAVSYWYVLERNVLRDVKRPRFKPRDRLISDAEFEACKALAPRRIQLAMMLALVTGQRESDIINFKWTDIEDLPEPVFDPLSRETVTMELNVLQQKTGKRLGIGISKQLEKILDDCYKLPGGGKDRSQYVLPTCYGREYTPEGLRSAWQRVRVKWEKRGGENFHFHDIRALCATKCPSIEYAQKLLGHQNPGITAKIYRRGKERVMPLSLSGCFGERHGIQRISGAESAAGADARAFTNAGAVGASLPVPASLR